MESIARWVDGLKFDGTFSTGHGMVMDSAPEHGGNGHGPRPAELLLMGLAGCTGMDVIAILQKKRQKVSSFEVHVSGERRDEHPRIFTKVQVLYDVAGQGVDLDAVRQAVHLSEEKYCSVSAVLRQSVAIQSRIRVREVKP
jgi:putative redox protein